MSEVNTELLSRIAVQHAFLKRLKTGNEIELQYGLRVKDGKLEFITVDINNATDILSVPFPANWQDVVQTKIDELRTILGKIMENPPTFPP